MANNGTTMAGASSPLKPTFQGMIATTLDALILFEACLSGNLNHVPRRPHDRERGDLIRSGNVFIYEEHASGIKRWTDGVSWSPSRILQNFLIYRELDKPFAPGEKKRALKKKLSNSNNNHSQKTGSYGVIKTEGAHRTPPMSETQNMNRALVGSLIDSYAFRPEGLVKKTISINYQGVNHHLVSYYTVNEADAGTLVTPSQCPGLQHITPRTELTSMQNFRANWEESEIGDRRLAFTFAAAAAAHAPNDYMASSNGAVLQQGLGVQGGFPHGQMPQHMASQHMPGQHMSNYGLVAGYSTPLQVQQVQPQGHPQQQYYHPAPPPPQASPQQGQGQQNAQQPYNPQGYDTNPNANNAWMYGMDGWR